MKHSRTLIPTLIICLLISFFILCISWIAHVKGVSLIQRIFSPIQMATLHTAQSLPKQSQMDLLKAENAKLLTQLAHQQQIEQENQALRDQFAVTTPQPQSLLPAHIVAIPSFVPGINNPEDIVIDKGSLSGLSQGNNVVVKDSLIGTVNTINTYTAEVVLTTNAKVSFTAKDSNTGALGIVKGQGNGEVIFDNVLLSDKLAVGDVVVTNYSPQLVIGKITSIERNPSDLFQRARVESLIDVAKLTMVFVLENSH
jgi:rod shape-determining protein MreC